MRILRRKEKGPALVGTASQWTLIWNKFKRHRVAVFSGAVVFIFYAIAISVEFVAPYNPYVRDTNALFAPPMRIRLLDEQRKLSLPFAYGINHILDLERFERIYTIDKTKKYSLQLFVRGDTYKFWGLWTGDLHLFGTQDGSRVYLFGTDEQGRDLLSRVIYGTRISLSIGLVGIIISFGLGIFLGAISGYYGGIADIIIQRIIEVFMCIPSLPLWMALSAALPFTWPVIWVFFAITVILSLMGWTGLARVVRGKLISLRDEEFVIAARLDGAKEVRIMFKHMLPSFASHLIATATLSIPGMILGETALSFLGIGLRAPAISWGVLLQSAQNIEAVAITPWLLLPGLFVVIVVLAFNFFGDGLRDAADPYTE